MDMEDNDKVRKNESFDSFNKNEQKLLMITKFRPGYDQMEKTVKMNWSLTQRSKMTRKLYDFKVIKVNRKAKSIKDFLVRSKLDYHPNTDSPPGSTRRNKHENRNKEGRRTLCNKNCRVCPLLIRTGKMKSRNQKHKFTTKFNVNCQSSNLIYCIKCKCCKKEYVGQTKRTIKERINEHITSVKQAYKKTEVSRHFCGTGHNGIDDMEVHILDFIHRQPHSQAAETLRKCIEHNWIQRLQTQAPRGLNIMDTDYG